MNKEFWNEVEALINPVIPVELEYRLYYNELGEITSGSMANHSGTDNYIVVTQTEYNRYFDYRVAEHKLKKIDRDSGYCVKLTKSDCGFCVVKNHAGLILEPEETFPTIEYYAYRNN